LRDGESPLPAYGLAKRTVSARFVWATGERLPPFLQRPLTTRVLVLYLDAIVLGSRATLGALGVDTEGRQHVLGLRAGATENATVTTALLEDLVARGLEVSHGILAVLDRGTARAAAVMLVFGARALIQRCQVHKRRNLREHLPQQDQGWVNARLSAAWALADAGQAQRELEVYFVKGFSPLSSRKIPQRSGWGIFGGTRADGVTVLS
jgi:putative transposase